MDQDRIETTGKPNDTPRAFSAGQRRHELRITRLRNIISTAARTGELAAGELAQMMLEDELGA